jgi:hypothetical protein
MQEQQPRWRVPDFVWIVPVILVLVVFGGGLFVYRNSLSAGLDIVLWWFKVFFFLALIFVLARIAYLGYEHYHDFHKKRQERKQYSHKTTKLGLQNEILAAQVDMAKQLPVIMKYAMEQGHNITYSIKGDLQVENYLSRLATLGNGSMPLLSGSEYLPDPYKMSDTLREFVPSKDGILLAKSHELITVPIGEPLCHTTFTGNTDAGKTNDERFLAIQLLYLEQIVYWCDRNYQPFRMDKKQGCIYDYTPIERLLAMPTVTDTKTAVALLKHLYGIVEERRLERRKAQSANALVPFRDIYLFFDELPAFAGEDRDIMLYIGRLLREARQYGVFFIGAAQDLLNTTLSNDNGAIRDNLLTNYYGGGDMTTARMVLNLGKGERIDETGLGIQGAKYLRAKGARIERMKVRTPWCDDAATHMLLDDMSPQERYERFNIVDAETQTEPLNDLDIAGDLRQVYNAVVGLLGDNETVSSRNVAEITGFGKDKCNFLLNELEARDIYTGRLSDRQTDKTPAYQTGQTVRQGERV